MEESFLARIFCYTDAAYVVEYQDGFVAKAYKWAAPGTKVFYYRDGRTTRVMYDRKRAYGRGPCWVAMSEKGGRLFSY